MGDPVTKTLRKELYGIINVITTIVIIINNISLIYSDEHANYY